MHGQGNVQRRSVVFTECPAVPPEREKIGIQLSDASQNWSEAGDVSALRRELLSILTSLSEA